ncbi:MAG: VIT domain-containing protein [Desulfatitalea sp.]
MFIILLHVLTVLSFLMMFGLGAASPAAAAPSQKTLSPYFFIENGEEGVDRLPLKATEVAVTINAVIAQVKVVQQYANEGTRPLHARYVFPASTRAAVHGMRMIIGEQVVVARIQERQAAKETFQAAKQAGQSASLLTEERPNVFTMQVANILPGDTIRIELEYSELLVPTDGTYEFVYPAVVGPRYSTVPEAGADDRQQWLQNPYQREGSAPTTTFAIQARLAAGMPIAEMACASHQAEIVYEDASRATVRLAAAESGGGNRDYILRYRLTGRLIQSGVIRYAGEKENFFVMMVQPPERVAADTIVPREYIFVVDVSGSMNGFPLDTAKMLLRRLIGGLRPVDRFNVVLFAGAAQLLSPASLTADTDHLAQAIALIDRQEGGGGTELRQAMETALGLPAVEGVARSVVVVTDGYIALEQETFALIDRNLDHTNFFAFGIGSSVNRFLIEGLARVGQGEPFVVTDPGEANAAAEQFRHYIEAPVLTHIKIAYDGWEVYDLEPARVPDLFAQRPLVVCGKWRGNPTGSIRITGITGQGPYEQTLTLAPLEVSQATDALPYLWARTRLARLSDFNVAGESDDTRGQITSLGLTYHLLTAHTAFVAVDETVRNPNGTGEDVDQPLPLPKGVSNLAIGNGHSVPEPGLVFMSALLGLGVLASYMRKSRRLKVRRRQIRR